MVRVLKAAAIGFAALLLLAPVIGADQGMPAPPDHAKKGGTPPGLEKKGGVPPGQAKRGCLPPGLAKKYGAKAPCRTYLAVDPEQRDRVWFLVDGQWVARTGLELSVRQELEVALELDVPAPPLPPVPLPRVEGHLTVMLFGE